MVRHFAEDSDFCVDFFSLIALKNLVPPSQPIRCKSYANCTFNQSPFPRIRQFLCFFLGVLIGFFVLICNCDLLGFPLKKHNESIFCFFIKHNKSMSYDEPLTTAGMKSLYRQRLNQALILLFKCLKGMEPSYLGILFKYRHTPYGLRGEACLWNCLILTFKVKKAFFSLTCSLSYGTICPLKYVFQGMSIT